MKRLIVLFILGAIAARAQLVPPITAQCATSIDGSVVGTPNPLNPPIVSAVYSSGTVAAGTYFAQESWVDAASHQTLVGPEVQIQLTTTGEIQELPSTSGIANTVVSRDIYIGTSSGTETLQGSATGSSAFTLSSGPTTGAAEPSTNTTICQVIANDAGWPTGTGYNVSLTSPAGSTLPGYPLQVQLLGPGNTINVSQGLPLYNGTVTYPVPILARPYGHATQSISGGLNLTNYKLVNVNQIGIGTQTPGWGLDVEGPGTLGQVNAAGLLIGGSGGTFNYCLGSDGTAYDVPIHCLFPGEVYYQTVEVNDANPLQEGKLSFNPGAGMSIGCTNNVGTGTTNCDFTANTTIGPNPNTPTLFVANGAVGHLAAGSNDGAGTIILTNGNSGVGTLASLTFGGTYSQSMFCTISSTLAVTIYVSAGGATGVVLTTGSGASGTGTINYLCHQ